MFKPFIKIQFRLGEPLLRDPSVRVPLPRGFRFEPHGGGWRLSWRWISIQAVAVSLFALLWDSILVATLYGVSSSKSFPLFVVVCLLALVLTGAGMTYTAIAYLIDRTSVIVDGAQVSVRHGPLPWFGERTVARADIAGVVSEKHTTDDDGGFDPAVTYKVVLLLKTGGTLTLVSGLRRPEHALFIEDQIAMLAR
jgi:hypothetical protein